MDALFWPERVPSLYAFISSSSQRAKASRHLNTELTTVNRAVAHSKYRKAPKNKGQSVAVSANAQYVGHDYSSLVRFVCASEYDSAGISLKRVQRP